METFSFPQWLNSELEKQNLTPADLSRKSGIQKGTLSRILNGDRNPSPSSLEAIANGLNMPVERVFREAGLLPPANDDLDDLEEWKHLLSQLPEKDRDELYEIGRLKVERREREEQTGKRNSPRPAEG